MDKATILSVDDDEGLQLVLKEYLESDGYKVLRAHNVKDFAMWAEQGESIDLVLLDLVLNDAQGLSLIQTIREKIKSPIIIVSGKTDTTEKIVCLEMGADDYITKPFEMRELSARVKAVLRRAYPEIDKSVSQTMAEIKTSGEKIYFENWYLDCGQYQLYDLNDNSAELTTGEFKLLETLVLSAKKVVSRERLFEITRDGANYDSYDRAIDIQIARIRKKIGDNSKDSEVIKTVRGVGYMFCATIKNN